MQKTPEDESEHLPPDDEGADEEEEGEEEPVGPPAPSGVEEPKGMSAVPLE